MNLSRIRKIVFINLSQSPWLSRSLRPKFVKWGGVNIENLKDVRIGQGCVFDTTHPEDITIEDGAHIGLRCIIITHFKNPKKMELHSASGGYDYGKVVIGKNAWIGANTIICKPVIIGEGAIVGASSVVTKDIPPYEIWAGNPAKFVKVRPNHDNR